MKIVLTIQKENGLKFSIKKKSKIVFKEIEIITFSRKRNVENKIRKHHHNVNLEK